VQQSDGEKVTTFAFCAYCAIRRKPEPNVDSYTPTPTLLLLHSYSYTPTPTLLLLHSYSYTPTPTLLLLHSYSYTFKVGYWRV
jgi:hypothetical protein